MEQIKGYCKDCIDFGSCNDNEHDYCSAFKGNKEYCNICNRQKDDGVTCPDDCIINNKYGYMNNEHDAFIQSKVIKNFEENLINNQQDLPPEFSKILNDNFWELLSDDNDCVPVPMVQPKLNFSDVILIKNALQISKVGMISELQERCELIIEELLRAEQEVKNNVTSK